MPETVAIGTQDFEKIRKDNLFYIGIWLHLTGKVDLDVMM